MSWRDKLKYLFRALLHNQHGRPPYQWDESCKGCTRPKDFIDACDECPFNFRVLFQDVEDTIKEPITYPLWNAAQRIMGLHARISKFSDEVQYLTEFEREALLILQSEIDSYTHWAALNPPKRD